MFSTNTTIQPISASLLFIQYQIIRRAITTQKSTQQHTFFYTNKHRQ